MASDNEMVDKSAALIAGRISNVAMEVRNEAICV